MKRPDLPETAAEIERLRAEGYEFAKSYADPGYRNAFECGIGTLCNMLLMRAGIGALPVLYDQPRGGAR